MADVATKPGLFSRLWNATGSLALFVHPRPSLPALETTGPPVLILKRHGKRPSKKGRVGGGLFGRMLRKGKKHNKAFEPTPSRAGYRTVSESSHAYQLTSAVVHSLYGLEIPSRVALTPTPCPSVSSLSYVIPSLSTSSRLFTDLKSSIDPQPSNHTQDPIVVEKAAKVRLALISRQGVEIMLPVPCTADQWKVIVRLCKHYSNCDDFPALHSSADDTPIPTPEHIQAQHLVNFFAFLITRPPASPHSNSKAIADLLCQSLIIHFSTSHHDMDFYALAKGYSPLLGRVIMNAFFGVLQDGSARGPRLTSEAVESIHEVTSSGVMGVRGWLDGMNEDEDEDGDADMNDDAHSEHSDPHVHKHQLLHLPLPSPAIELELPPLSAQNSSRPSSAGPGTPLRAVRELTIAEAIIGGAECTVKDE